MNIIHGKGKEGRMQKGVDDVKLNYPQKIVFKRECLPSPNPSMLPVKGF
jgi:hypothetical protein